MAIVLASQVEPIPGYVLVEHLGSGGFGDVWKAQAPGGIPKAIKFIKGNLDDIADGSVAATQELKALNRVKDVHHPFILGLERVDIIDGQVVIVMELADRNLTDRLEECQGQGLPGIPRAELLGYMDETAEALDLMNVEYQLQHLDIKPANLFLVYNHVKVADFGLVKDMEGMTATVTSGITPVYAAPETFEGKVTRFSDQYSFAIVYMELLTGKRPFKGTNARHLLMQHLREPPDLSYLPPGDREILAKALAKNPNERFTTCTEFVAALRRAPATPVVNTDSKPVGTEPPDTRTFNSGRTTFADVNLGPDGLPAPKSSTPPSRKVASVTGADFELPPEDAARPRLGSGKASRPGMRVGRGSDTIEIESRKSPTVKVDKKDIQETASEEVPCPHCGKPLIDPHTLAWCGGCGYSKAMDNLSSTGQTRRLHLPVIGELPTWTYIAAGAIAIAAILVITGISFLDNSTGGSLFSGFGNIQGVVIIILGLITAAMALGLLLSKNRSTGTKKKKKKKRLG